MSIPAGVPAAGVATTRWPPSSLRYDVGPDTRVERPSGVVRSRSTGKALWSIPKVVKADRSTACGGAGLVFVACDGSVAPGAAARIVAFDPGKDTPRWNHALSKSSLGESALGASAEGKSAGAKLSGPVTLDFLGGELLAHCEGYAWALAPKDGSVLHRWRIAKELKLLWPKEPTLRDREAADLWSSYGGVAFAASPTVLLVSFQHHLVAIDRKSRKYLWSAAGSMETLCVADDVVLVSVVAGRRADELAPAPVPRGPR